ncbi:hypothetical protein [Ureibacillus manganicus]|uniref:DUF2157 domain-containing protein n=1 Tax=Ureibacillus manganicus DSM 26584 TaxID=1384049 RepID=A0A0A3IUL1_9BACL|nr:hypothetical protein [Ureibacillus manganicus]KGR78522.1 hypothetical protein CD29_10775 [Ureibacillus manganicus DSM 26584]
MPNPRKQIILNEILFWKQNKLLPEHYCDFLMTLYSEGTEIGNEENNAKKAVKAKEKNRNYFLNSLLFLIAMVLITLLFTFDQITLYLLIVVGIVAVLSLVGAIYFSKKQGLLAPILQIVAALLIFSLSVKISISYFPDNLNVLYSLLIANCLLWLGTGILSKLIYFIIAGSLGLIVLIGYQFFF